MRALHIAPVALLSAVALAAVAGCASLDAGPAFADVQRDVSDRIGRDVRWRSGTEADAEVARRIDALLARPVTAAGAVQIALLSNRRLQATYERLGVAQANLVQAGLLKNPILDIEVKLLDNVAGTKGALELAVVQDFLDVLMIPLRKRVAEAELRTARAEVTAAVLDLAAEAEIAMVRLQAARRALAMRRKVLDAADAAYDAARRLHEAGNITDLALAGHRALYEQAKLAVASAETAAVEARERINALMGLWGRRADWTPAPGLPDVPDQPEDLDNVARRALAASLDLRALTDRMHAVAAAAGIEIAEKLLPELAGGAAAEYEPHGQQWAAGPAVAVAIPVFDWGQARRSAAAHTLRRLWHEVAAVAIELRAASRAAVARLRNARRQSEYYRRVVLPLAEQITAETQLRYNAMQVGVFHLLDAKRREIDVRRRYILARRDYWTARAELRRLLAGRMLAGSAVETASPMPAGNGGDGH